MGTTLQEATDEELLRELLRRYPKHLPGPASRGASDREYLLPIGRDHHCLLSMWHEAADALGVK